MQKQYMLAVGHPFARQDIIVLLMPKNRALLARQVRGAWMPRIRAIHVTAASLGFMSLSGVPLTHLVFAPSVPLAPIVLQMTLITVIHARVRHGADQGRRSA